jgi:mannose-6-phosphate isomerase
MPALLDFQPLIKRIRWGGTRLRTQLNKPIGDATDAAESWEVCDHGVDQSMVASGPWIGRTLAELVRDENSALFGQHAGLTQFPLLIKFLDASDRLSLQVHPNDEQARLINPLENGKTEAWVILDAAPGSRLYAGLKSGVDRETLASHLSEGSIEAALHSFPVKPGDCVFIPAGTVHAIGEGILLAEVQQSSDITFRLHDWGRVGTDGKPRPLHIEESLDCIDFDRGPVDPVHSSSGSPQQAQELVRCPYFVIARHAASEPFQIPPDDRFHVLMILAGAAQVRCGEESFLVGQGKTLLACAARGTIEIRPTEPLVLLDAYLPERS